MEACKEPVLTVSSIQPETEVLRISVDCNLETLFESKYCPEAIKNALHGMISWHQRNETQISKALFKSQNFQELKACLTVMGINLDQRDTHLEIPIQSATQLIHFSDVRPTPDSDPIVACYLGMISDNKTITKILIALTGINLRELTLLTAADNLLGKALTPETINDFCNLIPAKIKAQSNYLGSAEYRTAMAVVTTRRALTACMEDLK